MTPFEGKVWKANVVVKEGSNEQWTLPFSKKSFDEAITSVGGVKYLMARLPMKNMKNIINRQ